MQSRPERLSQEDLAILELENELVAGHTCKVVRLSGALDASRLRREIGERLRVAPKLRMRLGEVNGEPWWLPDQDIDLEQHVVEAAAADDERGFLSAVAGLFSQHLDRSRPLWRIDVIPRLPDGDSAVIWRIHHALADGMTAMRMAGAVLWDEVPATAQPPAGSGRAKAKTAAPPSPTDRWTG
jgi:diacylglycerol O-acyltransferase / wax synthase